jgi:beta-lactamase class D OXA-2
MEQIAFLRRLFRNTLPFKVEHQRLVKDLMIKQATSNWILRVVLRSMGLLDSD